MTWQEIVGLSIAGVVAGSTIGVGGWVAGYIVGYKDSMKDSRAIDVRLRDTVAPKTQCHECDRDALPDKNLCQRCYVNSKT